MPDQPPISLLNMWKLRLPGVEQVNMLAHIATRGAEMQRPMQPAQPRVASTIRDAPVPSGAAKANPLARPQFVRLAPSATTLPPSPGQTKSHPHALWKIDSAPSSFPMTTEIQAAMAHTASPAGRTVARCWQRSTRPQRYSVWIWVPCGILKSGVS